MEAFVDEHLLNNNQNLMVAVWVLKNTKEYAYRLSKENKLNLQKGMCMK